ncbi:40S ribosomal protein S3a [Manis javanica]|nr:40S ribosomal protein S3a [Manis javanica]
MVDPFSKKDWYDVKAPAMFNVRNIGKTLVTRTQGTKIASDGLKGHVFEIKIEAHADVKTTNGYLLHLFCVGYTKNAIITFRRPLRLSVNSIGKDIEKACQSIYLLHDVIVRKVKMVKKPKLELGKPMELHGYSSEKGEEVILQYEDQNGDSSLGLKIYCWAEHDVIYSANP